MNFNDCKMVCISTENNTVNIIPLLQFGIKSVYVLSTKRAESEGWTERMRNILELRNIKDFKIIEVKNVDEKDIQGFADLLYQRLKGETRLVFNISGGQKVLAIVVYEVVKRRKNECNDYLLYVEGNIPSVYVYDKWLGLNKSEIVSDLSLDEMLYLYNSKRMEEDGAEIYPKCKKEEIENISVGRLALKYFLDEKIFRRVFFNYMKSRLEEVNLDFKNISELKETIQNILKKYAGKHNKYKLRDYVSKNFDTIVEEIKRSAELLGKKDYEGLERCYDTLSRVDFGLVFGELKSNIIKGIADDIVNSFLGDDVLLVENISESDCKKICDIIRNIGGIVKDFNGPNLMKSDITCISRISSPGRLFEYMIASKICDLVSSDNRLASAIKSVHFNVKLCSLRDTGSKNDSELDIVVTTRYGTLIVFEMKTFRLKHDTARGREYIAKSRSGPYGRAIIVSPLLSTDKKITDGAEYYPDYIPKEVRDQREVAMANGVRFWYLDEFERNFIKEVLNE